MAFISFIIILVFSKCPIYWTLCTCDICFFYFYDRIYSLMRFFVDHFMEENLQQQQQQSQHQIL